MMDEARDRPVRLTLVDQAVEHIRASLLDGRWDEVPSEAELVRELGISRGTLRRALGVLFDEGVLEAGGRGVRHRISDKLQGTIRDRKPRQANLVRILSPQPRFVLNEKTQHIFQVLSEALGRAGLSLEFEHHPGLWKLKRPHARMRKITGQAGTACWILYRSTEVVQRWFAESGIPTVVAGGIYPGVVLSHAEFDFVAASRHGAGILAARGCKSLAFLTVENATAGDHASAKGFEETARSLGLRVQTVAFDDTIKGLCRAIDQLLVEQPVTDGYLTAFANHAPATIGHLGRRGWAVPEKAAVISRMDSRPLEEGIPTVARYQMDAEGLGRALARLVLREVDIGRQGEPKSHVIIPDFIDGESAGGVSQF